MICVACALDRGVRLDPKSMMLGWCEKCRNHRVVGEIKK